MDLVLSVFKKLNVDQTVFIQFAILVVLFFLLKVIFFNKLQFVLELRESKTTKLEDNANKTFSEAESLSQKYKEEIDKTYVEAQEKYNKRKTEILDREKQNIKIAENQINQEVEQDRAQFVAELDSKKKEVLNNADSLAKNLVDKFVN
jgi:F-type H+-transporting ATPase subunit b